MADCAAHQSPLAVLPALHVATISSGGQRPLRTLHTPCRRRCPPPAPATLPLPLLSPRCSALLPGRCDGYARDPVTSAVRSQVGDTPHLPLEGQWRTVTRSVPGRPSALCRTHFRGPHPRPRSRPRPRPRPSPRIPAHMRPLDISARPSLQLTACRPIAHTRDGRHGPPALAAS